MRSNGHHAGATCTGTSTSAGGMIGTTSSRWFGHKCDLMYSQPASLTQTRDFAQAWGEEAFVQGVLARLPWYHQLALLDKLQTPKERRSPVHQHVYEEQKESLTALVRHHLETASSATSGRSAIRSTEVTSTSSVRP